MPGESRDKPEILQAIEPVAEAFESIGVPYYIGGSVASSAYGMARSTLDADLIADLHLDQVNALESVLKMQFAVDVFMIRDAISRRSSFNLIHLETMIKIDVFILKQTAYDRAAFLRRRRDTLDEQHGAAELYLASAEDVILNKLDWFRMGDEVSERQWNDVQGVLKVRRNALEMEYLREWAGELGLTNLLERALKQALPPQR